MESNNNYKYIKYNDFWQNNLQKLEEISKTFENDLYRLERKYLDFDTVYNKLTVELNILSSIYSSVNNIDGGEYLLKLKALLEAYKKRYTHSGINFRAIEFLNSKIGELREQSFSEFPKLNHNNVIYRDLINEFDSVTDLNIKRYNELKKSARFKWITFMRNGSWFISRFYSFRIIKLEQAEILKDSNSRIKIKLKDSVLKVNDIFSKYPNYKKINFFLIIELNNKLKAFAAEKLGRIIMSDRNFIPGRLTPIRKSKLTPGRLRIFGKSHIYLK